MSLDGNGSYSPPAPQFPAIPNTIIYADDFNQIILDIATALSTAIFRDGQAAFTADQSLGGNKLTNVKNGTNPQDATTVLQVFTDPVFVATTLQGFKVTGSMFQALMTTISMVASGTLTLTGTTLLDASASGEVRLPANTSIGAVSAAELAVLDGLTATTAELNKLHGATLTTAELNILAGALITVADLNSIPSKAPLDSPNFTGIPTAPTAAPGTNSNQIATMAALQAQAFSAALPNQAGNAGKFVSTDGVNAFWAEGLPTQTGNAGKTLVTNGTSASWDYRYPVKPAAGGGAITGASKIAVICDGANYKLPDFTGVSGFSVMSAANTTALPAALTTADGWSIETRFSAGSTKLLSALSVATPHGTWGSGTLMTPPQLATSGFTSGTSTPQLLSCCQLSAGKYVGLFGKYTGTSYNLALAVIDLNTNTIGAPVALSTGSSNTQVYVNAIFAVSESGFVAVYNDGSASTSVIAGTVSGTTITVGTSANIAAANVDTTTQLSASTYLCAYQTSTGVLTARAFKVSGTVVTLGTAATLDGTANNSFGPVLEPMTATTALVGYFQAGGGSNNNRNVAARVLSVSDTTITVNAQYQITSQAFNNNYPLMLMPFTVGATYLFGGTNSAGNGGTLHCLTVSGTAITFGTALNLTNGIVYGCRSKSWDFATPKPVNSGKEKSALRVSATQMLISGWGSANIRLIELSGTTLSNPSSPAISNASNTYDLVYDPANGADILAVGSMSMAKLKLVGSTLTVVTTVATPINVYASQTVTNSAVNYSGTWYSWKLPPAVAALSTTKWLFAPNSTTLTLNGAVL